MKEFLSKAKLEKSIVNQAFGDFKVYPESIFVKNGAIVAMARNDQEKFLIISAPAGNELFDAFDGKNIASLKKAPLNAINAAVLRRYFPWTTPISLRDRKTTIGCGDRLGLASAGHIAAIRQFQATPVLAQQSIRELDMTGRTYRQVVDDTVFLVFQTGFQDGYGADGDHLKKISDIDVALAADMPMITLDLSDVMLAAAGDWDQKQVDEAFAQLDKVECKRVMDSYLGKKFGHGSAEFEMTAEIIRRCTVMYGKALDFGKTVYDHLKSKRGNKFDLEISIDETTSPTLPSHHYFIARELNFRGVEFTSLAPRFIGEFQKAIDYIGDLAEFDRQFKVHADISKAYGGYKISVHSGSDKFAVYPTVGSMTDMRLHLKTAGTSWLEAVRVISRRDPVLYRKIHKKALASFNDMLRLYHITADITKIGDVDKMADADLPALLEMAEARQLLHITYGPILKDPELRPLFFAAMHKFEDDYTCTIEKHFEKHLRLLGVPKK
ncbi:MAG: tagaturonate epimerase family protein [Victivallaceae bacterium]|nr:tagaturonate epimerase family protein [Victivallaceae bacterium]MDD4180698.1 tagaturonate epimerase family protein [Victivallaceae bacterium]